MLTESFTTSMIMDAFNHIAFLFLFILWGISRHAVIFFFFKSPYLSIVLIIIGDSPFTRRIAQCITGRELCICNCLVSMGIDGSPSNVLDLPLLTLCFLLVFLRGRPYMSPSELSSSSSSSSSSESSQSAETLKYTLDPIDSFQ